VETIMKVRHVLAIALAGLTLAGSSLAAPDSSAIREPGKRLANGGKLLGRPRVEPLGTARVVLVTGNVEHFGQFNARANAVFKPGEEVRIYVEPTGFIVSDDNGEWIDMTADIKVSRSDGRVTLEKRNLFTLKQNAPKQACDTFVLFAVKAPAAGRYAVSFRLNENSTGRSLEYRVPFLVEPAAADHEARMSGVPETSALLCSPVACPTNISRRPA
jgi:hypothetical protein